MVDLAKDRKNNLYDAEKETLQKLKSGQMTLNQIDITLMYELLQLTCGLEPRSGSRSSVWSRNCPKEKRNCVEHLLYRYKELRNKLIHDFTSLEFLSDSNFENIEKKNERLLNSIVIEVGIRAELRESEIDEWQSKLTEDMDNICNWSVPKKKNDHSEHNSSQNDAAVQDFASMFRFKQRFPSPPPPPSQGDGDSTEIITQDILDRYKSRLDNGTTASMEKQSQASAIEPLYLKFDRRFWIDQLVSTNVLKDRKTMKAFLSDSLI